MDVCLSVPEECLQVKYIGMIFSERDCSACYARLFRGLKYFEQFSNDFCKAIKNLKDMHHKITLKMSETSKSRSLTRLSAYVW